MDAKLLVAFFRHQTASMVATAVDFATMILLVELVGVRPDAATMMGASIGAVVNFMLGRRWAFRASAEPIGAQAVRYVGVSGASAILNTVGEHALVHAWGQPYLSSRIAVSLLVSVFWNFPAHKNFVFRRSQ